MNTHAYPFRALVVFAALLAVPVVLAVLPLSRGIAWSVTFAIVVTAAALIAWHTMRVRRALEQNAATLSALGTSRAVSDLPDELRSRMPLVMVLGDALAHLFANGRNVHVGASSIWMRVDKPRHLPDLALAARAWRGDRPLDGVVLTLAPDVHTHDSLTQMLRVHRQALSDTTRLLGTRVPGYLAVYQRLTQENGPTPHWYGLSAEAPLTAVSQFDAVIHAAEAERHEPRAAGLASLIDWTWRYVNGVLQDPRQPAAPWLLHGAAWIDCGAASQPASPWLAHLRSLTHLVLPPLTGSETPWSLPEPLIEACPERAWVPPRLRAFAHAIAILACAVALACWGAGKNNRALIDQIGVNLTRYASTPASNDAARREAFSALIADRDRLDRHERTGVPLRLSFGMYRGAALLPVLNQTIASYEPRPSIITLDSMSLFDSGRAQLNPGSTRALVSALEMINAQRGERILIAGHTDDIGDAASNQLLSIARASAVRDWLMAASATPASAFAIQGYGDTRPIADNRSPEGRARNRRVEITLVPDVP
jgi:outer membrane protein OmpA-like peptidoglycan-associated protein